MTTVWSPYSSAIQESAERFFFPRRCGRFFFLHSPPCQLSWAGHRSDVIKSRKEPTDGAGLPAEIGQLIGLTSLNLKENRLTTLAQLRSPAHRSDGIVSLREPAEVARCEKKEEDKAVQPPAEIVQLTTDRPREV